MEVIVGIEVAVSVGGANVGVAVADGITNVDVAGKEATPDGLEQLASKSKIDIQKSLSNFISDLTK